MKKGFPGGMGGMNMNMLKQAQKMQQDMVKMQEELESKEYTASSGGGACEATVDGKHKLLALTISPDVIDPEDAEMLQDLIIAAVNEASRAAEEASSSQMQKLTGGMNIPGLF
ncbi:MAG: YbaB/EbfC family nucleoid-associated protein [Clostridia bacterium]